MNQTDQRKRILFVSYGGIHVHSLAPLILAMMKEDRVEPHVLGLTLAPDVYRDTYGIPCRSAKNFIRAVHDPEALRYGAMLLDQMTSSNQRVTDHEETIAYLGTSFLDLINQVGGEVNAWKALENGGRAVFLPMTLLGRVFDDVKPHLVVTTDSPRAEKAACMIAKERGIPSILVSQSFCEVEWYSFVSDLICVLSEDAKHNLMTGYSVPAQRIKVTGNPCYDDAVNYSGPVDDNWRREFLGFAPSDKLFLWADQHATYNIGTKEFSVRSEKEIIQTLEILKQNCDTNNVNLLVRPHPSQDERLYRDWCKQNDAVFADHELLPLLNAVDMVGALESTVLVHALHVGRRILQVKLYSEQKLYPLDSFEQVWTADGLEEVAPAFSAMIEALDKSGIQRKQMRSSAKIKILALMLGLLFPEESHEKTL